MFRHIIIIFAFGIVLSVVFGGMAKMKQKTTYSASSSVMVANEHSADKSYNVKNDLGMMQTYADVASDGVILKNAQKNLKKNSHVNVSISELSDYVKVEARDDSFVLDFKVDSGSKKKSQTIVNTVVNSYKQLAPQVVENQIDVKVLSTAKQNVVSSTTSPSVKKYVLVGAAIGVLLGMVLVFAKDTWKYMG